MSGVASPSMCSCARDGQASRELRKLHITPSSEQCAVSAFVVVAKGAPTGSCPWSSWRKARPDANGARVAGRNP